MSAPANETSGGPNRARDRFGRKGMFAQFWWVPLLVVVGLAGLLLPLWSRLHPAQTVVVYCAQDQVYAEPIFRQFEKQTGIRVLPVYDSEAVKTVGLANRLLAERDRPRADVFWGNEELRARQLAARGVFEATNGLAFFGYRSRRFVVNTNLWRGAPQDFGLEDLTNAHWRGKVAVAYPQFGTTAAYFHALRQHWGEGAWRDWCQNLAANQARLVDGNSVVVKLVGSGEAVIGLTDSDDILAGMREGSPVAALPWDPETLYIPNSVGIINGAPHPQAARKLSAFLCAPQVAAALVQAGALEGIATPAEPAALRPDWKHILEDLDVTTEELNRIFLR
jgi:iron(III) transport system substrate-binding protein